MKIVRFKNGKFGIRRGWFKYEYLSIYDGINSQVVWSDRLPIHHFFRDEIGNVKQVFDWINDVGTEFKDELK